jgi:hypothetical protein
MSMSFICCNDKCLLERWWDQGRREIERDEGRVGWRDGGGNPQAFKGFKGRAPHTLLKSHRRLD